MPSTVWKGFISFGLVSFPVRLFAGARAQAVHFHLLHKNDLSRVKEVWYCAKEDTPIERSEVIKGYETTKGHYVVVDDEELKSVAPATATTMDVLQFVGANEVDPLYFESSYYVAPEKENGKAFALFVAALAETQQNAIAKIAMHNREHIVLLRPSEGRLVLHTLFYPDELNATNRVDAPATKYSEKELDLAKDLVNRLTAPFKPQEFSDAYRDNVERLIEQKRRGHKITKTEQPKEAPVLDLTEALKRSLERGATRKKPAKAAKKRSRPARVA